MNVGADISSPNPDVLVGDRHLGQVAALAQIGNAARTDTEQRSDGPIIEKCVIVRRETGVESRSAWLREQPCGRAHREGAELSDERRQLLDREPLHKLDRWQDRGEVQRLLHNRGLHLHR
jgi:hypothetical protein